MKLKTVPDMGPAGTRLKVMNPDLRAFVIEVMKATTVYRDMLAPDENAFAITKRNAYAVENDDMIVTNEDVAKFGWIAKKLNLK